MVFNLGVPEVVAFDAAEDRWQNLGPSEPRAGGGAVVDPLSGALVLFGGNYRTGGPLSAGGQYHVPANQALDAPEGAWRTLAAMPTPVHSFAAAVIGERLFVAGGASVADFGEVTTLQIYDFRSQTWSIGPPLPQPNKYAGGCAVGTKFFVIGGDKNFNNDCTGKVFIYDTEMESWTEGSPLPNPRYYHTALVHSGRLVVIGGDCEEHEGTSVPLVLDEAAGTWLRGVVPPLPPPFADGVIAAMICSVPIG